MRLLEPAVAAVSNQKIDTILNTGYFDTTFIQFHQLIGLNDWKLRVGSPILRLFHDDYWTELKRKLVQQEGFGFSYRW